MKILLPELKLKKITILSMLARRNYGIDELAGLLKMSRRTIHHYMQEINSDASDYLGVDKLITATNYGDYSIERNHQKFLMIITAI